MTSKCDFEVKKVSLERSFWERVLKPKPDVWEVEIKSADSVQYYRAEFVEMSYIPHWDKFTTIYKYKRTSNWIDEDLNILSNTNLTTRIEKKISDLYYRVDYFKKKMLEEQKRQYKKEHERLWRY